MEIGFGKISARQLLLGQTKIKIIQIGITNPRTILLGQTNQNLNYMADQKISELTAHTSPIDTDIFPILDITASETKKISITVLKSILLRAPEGTMYNGKIVPSVASNNLTVALKTMAGNNPSASDPVNVMIGGVNRTITSALSVTLNAATNWMNLGSAELATKETDFPTFLSYNATDGVVIGFSRYFGNMFSDFSATTTNEKYLAYSGSHAASSDPFVNIGRFAATLSAGAGYTWSVPTFTALNLVQKPTCRTRPMNIAAVLYGSSGSAGSYAQSVENIDYEIIENVCYFRASFRVTNVGSWGGTVMLKMPFAPSGDEFPIIGFIGAEGTNPVSASYGYPYVGGGNLIFITGIGATALAWTGVTAPFRVAIIGYYKI